MVTCIVSFLDQDGFRHSVEVPAESLFEAALLAVQKFKTHNYEPGENTNLDVEVRTTTTHTVTISKIKQWVDRSPRGPQELIQKQRLRELL